MGVQRVLALFVLCTIFGASVWLSTASSTPSQLSLTAAAAAPKTSVRNVGDGQCPAPSATQGYNAAAPKYPRKYCDPGGSAGVCLPPKKQKQNLYGKTCSYTLGQLKVTGKCVSKANCKGEKYKDQSGKECTLSEGGGSCNSFDKEKLRQLRQDSVDAQKLPEGGGERVKEIEKVAAELEAQIYPEETKRIAELENQRIEAETSGDVDRAEALESEILGLKDKMFKETEPTIGLGDRNPLGGKELNPESSAGRQQPAPSVRPPPIQGIERIANTPPAGGQQGWNPTVPQNTFNPSPILNNIANWGGIPSGGGSSPFGGGSGGYVPSGGNIAYVPVQQYGSLTSPNFDPPTAINFPEAQPSPEEILEALAKNTKRQSGEKVTEEELRGERVVDNAVMKALDNFFTPAGEFIRGFFAKAPIDEASNTDADPKREEDEEEKSPLKRGRLVLTLAADDSLVPGDPSQVGIERSDRRYQAFESIPASNSAWVQSAPRSEEGIQGIASAPTYGWGDAPEDVEPPAAPDVADTRYDPFGAEGDARSSPDVVEDDEGEPRSFFSVMGKSFGTIGEAVDKLFKRITSTLFGWL